MHVTKLFCLTVCLLLTGSGSRAAVFLGDLVTHFHQVRGGLYAIDEKTFFIENFNYDGAGITVYVYIYLIGDEVDETGGGIIVNWSSSMMTVPERRYNSENVTISLLNGPETAANLNISNIQAFTIWCEPFELFFGSLILPANVSIPSVDTSSPTAAPVVQHCAQLHDDLQVFWTTNSSHIKIKQCGCISDDQYMAFGISGDDAITFMVGADVVVAWVEQDGVANAVDYYINERQQCRGGEGVCPDTLLSQSGTDDITIIGGGVSDGMTCVEYERSLTTSDPRDSPYLLNNQTQFVAWALGPLAAEEGLRNLALFHTEWPRSGANFQLNFAQGSQCVEPLQCIDEMVCAWEGANMTAMEPTTFFVKIGSSGGLRGYQAITGLSGWGIALYINDTLIPVLRVRRGVTYTFIVEAGNDVNDRPRYHPFYITDSIEGGILLDTPEDRLRKNEQVFAGFDLDSNQPTAAGRYCEHVETSSSGDVATNCSSRLEDYLSTLTVSCRGDESEAAILQWTPDDNTPDLVYYQCANHFHLGWSIEVVNGTDSGIGNITDPGMGNITDPGMGNTTNTTDSMGNGIQNNTTDVDMRNNTDIGMRNITNNVTGMDMDSGETSSHIMEVWLILLASITSLIVTINL